MANVQSGSEFILSFVNLVDSNGATVATEAHLHITKPDNTVDVLTSANGDIDYFSPSTDPETGAVAVNRYEASAKYITPGMYRYQWHFPDIDYADKQLRFIVSGPVIVEPTP